MSIDLTGYSNLQANNFVKIVVPDYAILTFSDYHKNYTVDGTNYTGLGSLMSIGQNRDEIRATSADTTVTVAGIPTTVVSDILNYPLNGCAMQVWRVFFNPETGAMLSITGNPLQKFKGYVDNFAITEEPGSYTEAGTVVLTFTARSQMDLLARKRAGRATNPTDEKRFFPNDLSMDRVPTLANSKFNFGAEK